MSEDAQNQAVQQPNVVDAVPPQAPTDPTPAQVPGPPPVEPEPVSPTVKAEPTPEQIEEAKQYVVSKGYDYAGASKVVAQYGAAQILEAKSKDAAAGAPTGAGQQSSDEPPAQLPPGSVTVRVFDYDTRKPLHIMEQRDAGREFDVYVRTR